MGGTFGNATYGTSPISLASSKSPSRAFDPLNLTGADQSAQERAQANANQFMANAPRPADMSWNPVYNSGMNQSDPMRQALSGVNLDRTGLNQFQGEATRQGPSKWAQQATAQQNQLSKNALDMGAQSVAGQGATARSQLAMRGGLSGGAAERVAMDGQNNYLNMAQGINQQKTTNDMQIGMNDEQNRMQQLGMLPGMQTQASNFDLSKVGMQGQALQNDVGNQMQNNMGQNAFNLGQYQQQMQAWGAGQTAAATALGGSKGGKGKK